MRRIKLLLIILCLFSVRGLFSIGFGYHVLEVGTVSEFGKGIFPLSLNYQFNFPMPDFISGNDTLLAFRLDNGLNYRRLNQWPEDGRWIDSDSTLLESFEDFPSREYSVQFDEFNLLFEQGFFGKGEREGDLLTLHLSLGGRFEMAFDTLSWMTDPDNVNSLFYISDGSSLVPRFPSSSFVGAPELGASNRSSTETFITAGLKLNSIRSDRLTRSGYSLSSYLRYSPEYFPLSDGTANFIISLTELDLAYTPLSLKFPNGRLSALSLILEHIVSYRYLGGDRAPTYVAENRLFDSYALNTESLIKSKSYITLCGPELGVRELYPRLTLFNEVAFSFGRLVNTPDGESSQPVMLGVAGLSAELNIFNIARFYYKTGFVYTLDRAIYGESRVATAELGFTLGI